MDFCFQLGYSKEQYIESLSIAIDDIDAHPGSLLHCLTHPGSATAAVTLALAGLSCSINYGVVMLQLDDIWRLTPEQDHKPVVDLAAQVVTELYRSKGTPLCLETLRNMLKVFKSVDKVHENLQALLDFYRLGPVRSWLPPRPQQQQGLSSCKAAGPQAITVNP